MLFKRLLPLALAVMLTGCAADGGGPTQQALDFRTALMDSGGCTFTADLTADVGGGSTSSPWTARPRWAARPR